MVASAGLQDSTTTLGGSLRFQCVIALVNAGVKSDAEWIRRLEHRASTVVGVDNLRTGNSSEVEGKVSIMRKRRQPFNNCGDKERSDEADKTSVLLGVTPYFYAISPEGSRVEWRDVIL